MKHKYTWQYHLHHPQWPSHTGRLRLEQNPGETMQHLMMKACSYFIFYHPQLMIEQKTQQRHKPDLIRWDESGAIVEWIDCGITHLKKLKRITNINHSTMITIVKKHVQELDDYCTRAKAYVNRPERLQFQSYQNGFIDHLSHHASQSAELEVTVLADLDSAFMKYLYISMPNYDCKTEIIWRFGVES